MTRTGAFCACTNAPVSTTTANARSVLPTLPTLPTLPSPCFHEFPDGAENIGSIDVALRVHGHAFCERGRVGIRVWTRIRDERLHGAVAGAADADAAPRALIHAVAHRQRGHARRRATVTR